MSTLGGFLPVEAAPATEPREESVLAAWSRSAVRVDCMENARSALHCVFLALRDRGHRRARLPAFVCPSVAEAAARAGLDVVFHDLGTDLGPQLGDTRPGDVLLFVDYFGRIPPSVADLRQRHDDLPIIEDRAQALDPGAPVGDFVVYSPRKLVGVGGGGVLVQVNPHLAFRPDLARPPFFSLNGMDAGHSFAAFRRRESRQRVSCRAIDPGDLHILARIPMGDRARRRRENFEALARLLPGRSLFPAGPVAFAPLGFPVVVASARDTQRALAARGVYAALYWPELPTPSRDFPITAAVSTRVIVLPCDHRYLPGDMQRVAEVFDGIGA